jgi:tRNA (guanine6-N2)-methyltransferase
VRPLHHRRYRLASRPGALHPPLARALALLAAPPPDGVLLDPFCGTGTIPIEARCARADLYAVGSDFDTAAVGAARTNAPAAGVPVALSTADAARLPFPPELLDAVATNPPWGAQVRARGRLRGGLEPFWFELARVVWPQGRVVLLVPPAFAVRAGFALTDRLSVRVFGTLAEIVVLSRE